MLAIKFNEEDKQTQKHEHANILLSLYRSKNSIKVKKRTGTDSIHVIEIPTVATPKPNGSRVTSFPQLKCWVTNTDN
jgi:hypothetical protein